MANPPDQPEVEDLIRYDVLAQEALRGVVKKVLNEVAQIGSLPGEHHFYITFDTNAPGVKISPRMKGKYPDDMTIVVQHQYWDLKTTETGFSIGLSFNDVPETLAIPFAAIRGFFDPAVQFGLQFDAGEADAETGDEPVSNLPTSAKPTAVQLAQTDETDGADTDSDGASADVVSLDAFRKK